MVFRLDKDAYLLAKSIDFSEIAHDVSFDDELQAVTVSDEKILTFQVLISEEIDVKGLSDNQEQVTPYGRQLYVLYDTINALKHKND